MRWYTNRMKNFSWQTPEYVHKEKTTDWYWTVGIISAALVVTCMIFGNFLFAIVLAIGAFCLVLFAARKPRMVDVHIDDKGIVIEKTLYPYSSLSTFGLDDSHHDGPRLFLRSSKPLMPLVTVPIRGRSIDELREHLSRHLKEEVFEQSLAHTIFEKMGF
jgi:hypothetical protein